MIFNIELVKAGELTKEQETGLTALNIECFGDVPAKEIEENFYAEPFAYLFAFINDRMISRVALFKRNLAFAGRPITVGGIGGVCVSKEFRHHGVASSLLKRALIVLKSEECDVACLNVDLEKKIYPLYEKLGFKLMEREISFENSHGDTVKELGTMFIELNSPDVFNLLMNSRETFHYGKGYW
jgi:predicted GNAT family N-acyltransferase